jgi:hypothetical protein
MMINGSSILTLGGVAEQPATPVVGRVRARIAYPLDAPPDVRGRFGRAWGVDLAAVRRRVPPGAPPDAMVAHWIIEAPWSHQVVHSYSLMVVHLRHMLGKRDYPVYLDGATHEMCLQAIRPDAPRGRMLVEPPDPRVWVEPMAFAAQIVAADDGVALRRVLRAVELVCEGRLSPHPSHARAWAELFGDNMLRRASAPVLGDQRD